MLFDPDICHSDPQSLIIGFHIRIREMVYQTRRKDNDGCNDLIFACCFPWCSAIQLKKEMEIDLHERKLRVLTKTFCTKSNTIDSNRLLYEV